MWFLLEVRSPRQFPLYPDLQVPRAFQAFLQPRLVLSNLLRLYANIQLKVLTNIPLLPGRPGRPSTPGSPRIPSRPGSPGSPTRPGMSFPGIPAFPDELC